MSGTQRVLWAKGVLLEPQHLQAQDRFFEELIAFQLASMSSYPWGYRSLQLDHDSIGGGTFAVTQGSGIMPDGLMFDFPASDPAPPPRPFAELFGPDQTELTVYLALPEHRTGGRNVADDGDTSAVRYSRQVILRRDENTGAAEKPVQVVHKNMSLRFEQEARDGTVSMPIGRVLRVGDGQFKVDSAYVPPLLDISASDHLLAITRALVEILASKSSTLGGLRRQRNKGLADFGVSDTANFWLLYTVNTHFPQVRHLFEVRRGHPTELYGALTALAGALTSFSESVDPSDLPRYDHLDLGGVFTGLETVLKDLLDTVVPTNHVSLPLRLTEPSMYATAIDQDAYFAGQAFLAVSSTMDRAELLRRVPQLLKVSSSDQVERLIRSALPGVRLEHVPNPPGEIPVRMDAQYFRLAQTGPEWDAVRHARNLVAYVPSDFPQPELELVIHLPKKS